jgi:hypothetical protein
MPARQEANRKEPNMDLVPLNLDRTLSLFHDIQKLSLSFTVKKAQEKAKH